MVLWVCYSEGAIYDVCYKEIEARSLLIEGVIDEYARFERVGNLRTYP